jgi:hypothetical protein
MSPFLICLAIDNRGFADVVAIPDDVLVSIALLQALIWCLKVCCLVNQRLQFGHCLYKLVDMILLESVSKDQFCAVVDTLCKFLDNF